MSDDPIGRILSDDTGLRAAIRRDMLRANTLVAVVLCAVLLLALAAALAGLRATRNLHRAETAEAAGRMQLASAYLAQARATRISLQPGRRQAALAAITNAAAISRTAELRTEAIACFALSELVQDGDLVSTPRDATTVEMGNLLEHFAYGDAHGRVMVYDAANRQWSTFETGKAVRALSFDAEERHIMARLEGGVIAVSELGRGRPLQQLPLATTTTASFLPNSTRIVFSDAAQGGLVSFYDVASGTRSETAVKAGNKVFKVSGDLKRTAVGADGEVEILDSDSGNRTSILPHNSRVIVFAWSPDSRKLAVSCEDGDIYLWDLARGGHRVLSGHSERCMSLGFSPNGELLYSSSQDGSTRLWNVALGIALAIADGTARAFSPDGKRLGFWKAWKGFGIWEVSASKSYALLPCDTSEGPLFSLDLSGSGRWCVATQNKGFRVWDLSVESRSTFVPISQAYNVRVSPDEKTLLVCRNTGLEVWPLGVTDDGVIDLQSARARQIPLPDSAGARSVAVSQDGHSAAVELTDQRLMVMDLNSHKAPVIFKDRWRVVASKSPASATGAGRYAISSDGRWVATGFFFGGDDVPKVWNAQTGELAATLKAETSVLAFSADGQRLGLAGVERYSFWSVGDWLPVADFAADEPSIAHGALAFAPEEGTVAITRTRQTVQIRDFMTSTPLTDLPSPTPQSVNSLRMSLDGSVLAGATASDMIEVWRLKELRRELANIGLDWSKPAMDDGGTTKPIRPDVANWPLTLTAILGGFVVASGFTLLTLRRHRRAVERFAIAEATAAQRNRELDSAKVELMHSQKMQALGTLAAGIAHDFNNLLSVIRMSNTLIGRQTVKDKDVQEHMADIEQAVLQGKGLVGAMLGYAREQGDEGGPVDASAGVEEVVSLLSKEFLRGITLTLELERDAPKVSMGRGPLEQILLNLIVNASEAMQGEGRLKIVVRVCAKPTTATFVLRPAPAEEYVELTVSDSGPGIPPEVRERMFEPFFTTKRGGAKPGTGLGLSLVYSLAQEGQAGLSVESFQGLGAEFTLVFPAHRADPVRQTHSAKTAGSL